MTIVCKMDKDGGFYAADCDTQQIEYAYPSSIHAEQAKKNPIKAAREMLSVPAIRYADRWEYMRRKMLAVETHPSMPVCATWDASDEQAVLLASPNVRGESEEDEDDPEWICPKCGMAGVAPGAHCNMVD